MTREDTDEEFDNLLWAVQISVARSTWPPPDSFRWDLIREYCSLIRSDLGTLIFAVVPLGHGRREPGRHLVRVLHSWCNRGGHHCRLRYSLFENITMPIATKLRFFVSSTCIRWSNRIRARKSADFLSSSVFPVHHKYSTIQYVTVPQRLVTGTPSTWTGCRSRSSAGRSTTLGQRFYTALRLFGHWLLIRSCG